MSKIKDSLKGFALTLGLGAVCFGALAFATPQAEAEVPNGWSVTCTYDGDNNLTERKCVSGGSENCSCPPW